MPVVATVLMHFPELWQICVLNWNFSILSYRCPFLHRTAGDTERRYHLRYYKTGSCIHETDAKGHCSKNGSHCAFAHGSHDLRSPVYDIRCNVTHLNTAKSWYCSCGFDSYNLFFVLNREVQVMESQGGVGATEGDGQSGQAASTALIEKIVSEEPRWQGNQCFNMPLLDIFTLYICMNLKPEIQTIKMCQFHC